MTSEQRPDEDPVRAVMRALRESAVAEEDRVNGLDIPLDEKYKELQKVVAELNEECGWAGLPVSIVGSRAYRSPIPYSAVADRGSFSEDDRHAYVLGPDKTFGISLGFGLRPVDIKYGDETKRHFVICHRVRTGETDSGEDPDGNLVDVTMLDYFSVRGSEVDFLEDLHYAFDDILNDPNMDIGERLRALYVALERLDFSEETTDRRNTMINYLNVCEGLFSPTSQLMFNVPYVVLIGPEGVGDVQYVGDRFVSGTFHGLMPVPYYELQTAGRGYRSVRQASGVGVATNIYPDGGDKPVKCIVPLNQRVYMRSEGDDRGVLVLKEAA